MAAYMQCMGKCFGWSGSGIASPEAENGISQAQITLDTSRMGIDAVIVKGGKRICGTGAGVANSSLAQDKAYFEVKVQSTGISGVGLCLPTCEVDRVPLGEDSHSWVLRHDGLIRHNKTTLHNTNYKPNEGDVIGVSYDHIELHFYVNGKSLKCPVTGIRGSVYPVLYVDESSILDIEFKDFSFPPPSGYSQIMVEQQIF